MKSPARFTVFKTLSVAGLALALLAAAGLQSAHAQTLTINFRFDGQTGAAATTQTLQAGAAAQDFTIDVWASIANTAPTAGADVGLVTLRFRGLSSTTNNTAFATGAGVGVTSFTMLSPFQSTAAIPALGDVGSASAYATTSTTLDGISDFGGTAATSAAVANSNAGTTPEVGGTTSSTSQAITNGWEFMVGQFVFHTGAASSTGGATTSFLPVTGLGAASSKQSFTVNATAASPTFLHGDWTSGSAINFVVAGDGGGNTSILNMTPATVTINSLTNGSNSSTLAVANTNGASAGAYTGAFTGTSAGASQNPTGTVNVPALGSVNEVITYAAPATVGAVSFGYTITNTLNGADVQGAGANKSTAFTVNVGNATADNSNKLPSDSTAFNSASLMTATVAHNGSYAGLGSQVTSVAGTGGGFNADDGTAAHKGGTATILAGTNTLANGGNAATVGMQWRLLSTNAGFNEQTGVGPGFKGRIYNQNLKAPTTGLLSDVVNLTGLTPGAEAAGGATDPYVLQMSFNPARLPNPSSGQTAAQLLAGLAANKLITMVSYNSATNLWDRAVEGNTNNVVTDPLSNKYGYIGSYAAFQADAAGGNGGTPASELGAWGIDTANDVVWSVLNHNSSFAIVPEPSTLMLAGLGLLGLFGLRRRMMASA